MATIAKVKRVRGYSYQAKIKRRGRVTDNQHVVGSTPTGGAI